MNTGRCRPLLRTLVFLNMRPNRLSGLHPLPAKRRDDEPHDDDDHRRDEEKLGDPVSRVRYEHPPFAFVVRLICDTA